VWTGPPADEALLAAMAAGDRDAATAFVRRFQRRVFGLALSVLDDPALAEEVAQEAFARAWRHAPVFDPRRATVATWLLTITRNLAIDALRMRRAEPVDPAWLVRIPLAAPEASVEDRAAAGDDAARVRTALAALPAEQRRALVLAAYGGRTAKEISAIEAIPLGTAKTRIRAALAKLRAALEEEPTP
jgi:RNA polymerase sigma-70 factor (ECF subfamily)